MRRLNWNDRAGVRRWVVTLRVVADDLDATVVDMLRPLRRCELGHRTHRAKCRDARKATVELLAYTLPTDDGGEHVGPSGNGGACPTQ